MYHHRLRFLFSLLLVVLLCSAVQATNMLISVQDNLDNTSIPQATVFVNGVDYALTNNNGQVLLTYPGVTDQDIKVSMAGYSDWEQLVDVNTQTISEKSSNRAGRSAGTIGGGTVGGAILGGILGGGKGAAIGAAGGAAGGTAVELATSGQRVRVPSETRLTFVLDSAVRI